MTDLEIIRDMMARADIEYEEENPASERIPPLQPAAVLTWSTFNKGCHGYPGFVAEMWFGAEGQLLRVGAWE
jgi:hypothetical protein